MGSRFGVEYAGIEVVHEHNITDSSEDSSQKLTLKQHFFVVTFVQCFPLVVLRAVMPVAATTMSIVVRHHPCAFTHLCSAFLLVVVVKSVKFYGLFPVSL